MATTYLITGASRGLGLEFVKQLLEAPSTKVIAASRTLPVAKLDALKKQYPDRLTIIQLDVTSTESVKAAAASTAKTHPNGIDYLINNAGVSGAVKVLESGGLDDFVETIDINTIGPLRVITEFLPQVKKGQKKVVVGISTILASIASIPAANLPGLNAYTVSKAALNALFATFARDFKAEGISFIPIHPGWVETDLGNKLGKPPLTPAVSIKAVLEIIHKHKAGEEVKLLNYDGTTFPW